MNEIKLQKSGKRRKLSDMKHHAMDREPADLLRAAGLRATRQRLALAEIVFGGEQPRHVTAEMLYGEAKRGGVKLSLATVYNVLHRFRDCGLMSELMGGDGRCWFDTNIGHHHHFWLEEERRLVDIDESEVAVARLPSPPKGRKISRVDVVIRLKS
jgi:Fur family iron response transcriptional regulator